MLRSCLFPCLILIAFLARVHVQADAQSAAAGVQSLPDSEREGLLALSAAVDGVRGNSTNPCEWVGIVCGTIDDTIHITGLVYDGNSSINGTFPFQILQPFPHLITFKIQSQWGMDGKIPSFGSNPELSEISISETFMYGKIPINHFQNNTKLQTLVLSNNFFGGPLPDLSYCRDLRILDVSYNGEFRGTPSDVSMLINLTYVNYGKNKFTGPIPMFDTNLQLTTVFLSNNQFTVPSNVFPNYCHLTRLQTLHIMSLQIQAPMPPSFGCMPELRVLGLENNAIYGEMSYDIFINNTQLTSLYLGYNNLSGILPTFQSTPLQLLQLHSNHFISPITIHTFPNMLNELVLSSNAFSGRLPIHVFPRNLTKLWLQGNQFNGTLPNDPFPSSQFPVLDTLMLSGNQFSGPLPAFPTIHPLSLFSVEYNQFTGSLPPTLPAKQIWLDHNQLTGPIPAWYGSSDMIQWLDVSYNQLIGPLPSFASSRADKIDLSYNLINGSVESAQFQCPLNPTYKQIKVTCNRMSGNACAAWNKQDIRCYDGMTDCNGCPNSASPTTPPIPIPNSGTPSSSTGSAASSSSSSTGVTGSTGVKNGCLPLASHTCLMLILAMTVMGVTIM